MFNDINPATNGEIKYYQSIKEQCKTVFDVGASDNSIFIGEEVETHYFEPLERNLNVLKNKKNRNTISKFNLFGLSDTEETLKYYDNHGSLIDRSIGPSRLVSNYSGVNVLVKRADEYIIQNNINNIDFLKIDVEGYELKVFKGFADKLKIVKYMQFEYGMAVADGNYTMLDMINYLKSYGFIDFSYISNDGLVPINDFTDHFNYCNIACKNKDL
jgi:FkbM family methyltransferase